jgi:hypothetical protein
MSSPLPPGEENMHPSRRADVHHNPHLSNHIASTPDLSPRVAPACLSDLLHPSSPAASASGTRADHHCEPLLGLEAPWGVHHRRLSVPTSPPHRIPGGPTCRSSYTAQQHEMLNHAILPNPSPTACGTWISLVASSLGQIRSDGSACWERANAGGHDSRMRRNI